MAGNDDRPNNPRGRMKMSVEQKPSEKTTERSAAMTERLENMRHAE